MKFQGIFFMTLHRVQQNALRMMGNGLISHRKQSGDNKGKGGGKNAGNFQESRGGTAERRNVRLAIFGGS